MIRRREQSNLDDVVELLEGMGVMLQTLDAKLEEIVHLLRESDDEEE